MYTYKNKTLGNKILIQFENKTNYILKEKYKTDQNFFNLKAINNILQNSKTYMCTQFKEMIITIETEDLFKKIYNRHDSITRLDKMIGYYCNNIILFPNLNNVYESKYICENIHHKQRILDELELNKLKNHKLIKKSKTKNYFHHEEEHNITDNNIIFTPEVNESIERDEWTDNTKVMASNLYREIQVINAVVAKNINENNEDDYINNTNSIEHLIFKLKYLEKNNEKEVELKNENTNSIKKIRDDKPKKSTNIKKKAEGELIKLIIEEKKNKIPKITKNVNFNLNVNNFDTNNENDVILTSNKNFNSEKETLITDSPKVRKIYFKKTEDFVKEMVLKNRLEHKRLKIVTNALIHSKESMMMKKLHEKNKIFNKKPIRIVNNTPRSESNNRSFMPPITKISSSSVNQKMNNSNTNIPIIKSGRVSNNKNNNQVILEYKRKQINSRNMSKDIINPTNLNSFRSLNSVTISNSNLKNIQPSQTMRTYDTSPTSRINVTSERTDTKLKKQSLFKIKNTDIKLKIFSNEKNENFQKIRKKLIFSNSKIS
jgi:hypothetical protein